MEARVADGGSGQPERDARGDEAREDVLASLRRRMRRIGGGTGVAPAGGEGPLAPSGSAPPSAAALPSPARATPPAFRRGARAPIVYRRDLPARSRSSAPPPIARGVPPLPLAQAVPGEELRTDAGALYRVRQVVAEMDGGWGPMGEAFRRAMEASPALRVRLAACGADESFTCRDALFMDLETTGLSNSPLFLIGAMVWENEGLVVHQLLARDYSEERSALRAYADLAGGRRLLVTFNGKSFDVPYLRARSAACAVPLPLDVAHFDLLHESRRVWKHRLPDCRLQTLEAHVCGRRRFGDIPGHAIPDAYHAFVRTGDARQIAEILKHNLLDLLTLADLMARFDG